jgi:pimeloyl-ACP methyl ester carboxylesterase
MGFMGLSCQINTRAMSALRRAERLRREQHRRISAMPHVVSLDGTAIAYDVKGKGPAIILVAGATQYRAVDQHSPKIMETLAERFTVITYDRRGRGESGDRRPYAVAREIEDIAALIAGPTGGTAMLYGMSSGAVLALHAAAALPGITKVMCFEPPISEEETEAEARASLGEMQTLYDAGRGEQMMENFLSGVGMPPDQVEGFKQSPVWPAYAAVGHTIAYDYAVIADAFAGSQLTPRWQAIGVPVLVANGDASFDFIAGGAARVAKAVPGAARKVIPGVGHDAPPEVLAPVMAAFFAG